MNFMSNTAVFIVIAALTACAVGESTELGQPGALRLRLRRTCTSVCGPYGCQINCQRMRREDLATLDAALSIYEDATSEQMENFRVRRSSDAEETEAEEPLQLRLRRACTSVCGPYGCQINCQRMKRDDLATLDAAMAVYEDETSANVRVRRSTDAEETEDEESLQLRVRRVCTSVCGPYGCQINCQRMKREDLTTMDAALGVYEEANLRVRRSTDDDSVEEAEEPLQLRFRRVCTSVCGPYGCQINCHRMKREDLATLDAALGAYEGNSNTPVIRARRNCVDLYGIGPDGKPFAIRCPSAGSSSNGWESRN